MLQQMSLFRYFCCVTSVTHDYDFCQPFALPDIGHVNHANQKIHLQKNNAYAQRTYRSAFSIKN